MAFALAEEGRAIRVWRRDGEATVVEVVPFTPFLLLADPALLGTLTPGCATVCRRVAPRADAEKLSGDVRTPPRRLLQ